MSTPYTSGVWSVKPGSADGFVAAWTELAAWSRANAPGALSAQLLRDRNDANRFVSFGPWESLEAIEHWRTMEGFQQRVAKIRELLTGFEASTLELVVSEGQSLPSAASRLGKTSL